MSTFAASENRAYTPKRMIGLFLVLLGRTMCLGRAYLAHKSSPILGVHLRAVYGSGRCVLRGCNPYYLAGIRQEFLKHGGPVANLQRVVSHYRDKPSVYNCIVWAFSGLVLAVWLYPVIRRRLVLEKDMLCSAAIGTYSMLPIYNCVYYSRALLILFPAVALLMRRTLWWSGLATLASVVTSLVFSDGYAARSYSNCAFIDCLESIASCRWQ